MIYNYFHFFLLAPFSPGKDGPFNFPPNLHSGALDPEIKRSYPLDLLYIMHRQAEDLLLSNRNNEKGRAALQFILSLANDRSDVEEIKKGKEVIPQFSINL